MMASVSGATIPRKTTDLLFLIFCIVLVVSTLGIVGYCAIFGNLTRFMRPHDSCGNFCGELNNDNKLTCRIGDSGVDLRSKSKLLSIDAKPAECVEHCPEGYSESGNRCNRKEVSEEVELDDGFDGFIETMSNTWHYILLMCVVAFFFSYIFLILFRYAAKYVIWIINIGILVFIAILIILSLYYGSLEAAGGLGLTELILIIVLIWFRKRINLVAKLFKESSKALIDVPGIMFEPVLTFLFLLLAFKIFIVFAVIIALSRNSYRHENPDGSIEISYTDMEIEPVAHCLNIVTFIWFTQFILGCQHFVIGGTISKWYFTRDKTKVGSPIRVTFWHLIRFHLGSICFGALLITFVKILNAIVRSLKKHAKESRNWLAMLIVCCLQCFLDIIERILQYFVRNAYIIVAKEGTPFFQSGKRAFHLIMGNVSDCIALNHFGDIVLVICRLFIVVITGFVGYELLQASNEVYFVIPFLIGLVFAFLIAHCFVMVFEMTVDTIFLCFCIDCEENDGITSPYFMSEGLKQVMMDMKAEAGGEIRFTPRSDPYAEAGMAVGSDMPMLQQPAPGSYVSGNSYDPPPYSGPQVCQQQPYPQDSYQQSPYPQDQYPGNPPYPQDQYSGQQQPYPQTWGDEKQDAQHSYYQQQQPYPSLPYPPQ